MSLESEIEERTKQLALRDAEIAGLRARLAKAENRTSVLAVASSFVPKARSYPLPVVARTGTRLKHLRERLGLTQGELGERLGLARTSIANYENGRAPLSKRIEKWIAAQEKD